MRTISWRRMLAGALDAALAARHEPVEVGPADQDGAGAQRDRRDDVRAAQDAAVDVDLGAVADRRDDRRQLLERGRRPVELAAAVVGDDDRVGAGVDDGARVVDRLDALDDDRAVPRLAQPGEVGDRDGRVEDAVDQVGDGAAGLGERRRTAAARSSACRTTSRGGARCRPASGATASAGS